MSNIGRAIVKKLAVKFEGNEIMSMDDFNVLACWRDLCKTKSEKRNAIQQGIISTDGCTENCIKLRINASNKDAKNTQDKAIADLIIPLHFEMLDSAAPYNQAGLRNRPCYELTFIFMLPYIIMDITIFVIAEWATLLVDIRCPRGGS